MAVGGSQPIGLPELWTEELLLIDVLGDEIEATVLVMVGLAQ